VVSSMGVKMFTWKYESSGKIMALFPRVLGYLPPITSLYELIYS